jgi:hypothetical protein
MKVSNHQKRKKSDDGISRETLNDWQRKDAVKQKQQVRDGEKDEKEKES